jgi:hypothetical protein
VTKIINDYADDLARGAIISVDERAIRIRRLPI